MSEPMTPRQYLSALKDLGLTVASQRTAKLLGINVRQSQRYASGDATVPESIEKLLEMYVKHGTNETRVSVKIDGKVIEAVEIDSGEWDAFFPWGIERVYASPRWLVTHIRSRYQTKMAALDAE